MLLVEGFRNGRYHRVGRLRKNDQMPSKREIGELTSRNHMLQDVITKSREGIRAIEKSTEDRGHL